MDALRSNHKELTVVVGQRLVLFTLTKVEIEHLVDLVGG